MKASCGCTTPAWSREAVQPGESGFVQARYNPRNRPGKFNKSLTISNSLGSPIRVYIRGEVTPRERSVEEMYPAELGGLRMKYSSLNLGKVYINRDVVTRTFDIYNQSEEAISINKEVESPNHIEVSFDNYLLEPKAKCHMIIKYNAGLKDDLGFMNDNISFGTNEDGEY